MIVTIITASLILVLIQWLLSSPFRWYNKGIKWYKPWPIFGNTATFIVSSFADFWTDFYNRHPGERMVGFHIFMTPAILPRDPELIKQFLITDADSYNSHAFHTSETDPFSQSLFYAEGEQWKGYRSKLTAFFSPSRIKAMVPIIKETVNNFVNCIEDESKNGPFEADSISSKLSTDAIVTNIYGIRGDCFVNPNSMFFELQREIVGLLFQMKSLFGFISPRLYNLLGLTSFKKTTSAKLGEIIDKIKEARLRGEGVRPDFLQGMIELNEKTKDLKYENNYNNDGTRVARFDRDGILAQLLVMFSAGTDTTAHTLAWCLYELALNQNVQDRLRDEIMGIKKMKNNGELDYDDVMNMNYLDMVMSETLRKYPVAPSLFRKCIKATRLGGVNIDKGTIILMPIMAMHRDPRFYPQPEVFDPERFAPGAQRDIGSYFPFGLGPRVCIGMRFAQVEMKLALCELLSKLKISPCNKTPKTPIFDFGLTLVQKNGMFLNATPI